MNTYAAINIDNFYTALSRLANQPAPTVRPRFAVMGAPEAIAGAIEIQYRRIVAEHGISYNPTNELHDLWHTIARWLTNPAAKPGLMFCGTVGNGKTTTMKAVCAFINAYGKYIDSQTGEASYIRAEFVTAETIAQNASNTLGIQTNEFLKTRKMLGIDDLGVEGESSYYGMKVKPIQRIIGFRNQPSMLTMVTTNLSAADLRREYDLRTYDRLKQMFEILPFRGESFRK